MSEAYIIDACRTPRGRRKGSLAGVHPIDLLGVPLTAGNSSGIVDGAGVVLLASERKVKELKRTPRARVVDQVIVGSEPVIC
jgi:acetyl-CoA acetyltransferase